MSLVVDAHVHFLDPARYHYPWIVPALEPIRRAFRPGDLQPVLKANGVDSVVLVQTIGSQAETGEFLEIAASTDFVAGVIGWVDLNSQRAADQIEELRARPGGRFLVGIRHLVHDELDSRWLLREDVRRGLGAVRDAGLAYDLLVRSRELPAALEVARMFHDLRFVIDHIAKPRVARGEVEEWTRVMAPLAELPNVWCKLSGMVTEADWRRWKPVDLKPYVDRVVEWFGPERLLFGSDWPVCLLAASYDRMKTALEEVLGALASDSRIFGRNAIDAYRLPRADEEARWKSAGSTGHPRNAPRPEDR